MAVDCIRSFVLAAGTNDAEVAEPEKENANEEAGDEKDDEQGEGGDDVKVAKKKKPKKKNKGGGGGGLKQTNPPSIPIAQLFPDGE